MECPPVLFLVFNRPDLTARVFERIREMRPSLLYVAADGPRADRETEAKLCKQTRLVVDSGIDWKCRVERLYRDNNLGCRAAVSDAINWFFRHVEEGVILEDDCLPDPSFFRFCGELLHRYRLDTRVFHVSGFNPVTQTGRVDGPSYSCWHFGSIWGWATWRRACAHYDVDMKDWPDFHRAGRMVDYCTSDEEALARTNTFAEAYSGQIDTWDFQWAFARLLNNAVSITPVGNLVTNLGFGDAATHTRNAKDERANRSAVPVRFPLVHPDSTSLSREFGSAYWAGIRNAPPSPPPLLARRILNRVLRLGGVSRRG